MQTHTDRQTHAQMHIVMCKNFNANRYAWTGTKLTSNTLTRAQSNTITNTANSDNCSAEYQAYIRLHTHTHTGFLCAAPAVLRLQTFKCDSIWRMCVPNCVCCLFGLVCVCIHLCVCGGGGCVWLACTQTVTVVQPACQCVWKVATLNPKAVRAVSEYIQGLIVIMWMLNKKYKRNSRSSKSANAIYKPKGVFPGCVVCVQSSANLPCRNSS